MPSGPWNLWAAMLMAATPRSRKLDRQLAHDLHGVGVQRHAGLVADRRQLGDRLQHARLVVAQHHADQPRLAGARARATAPRGPRRRTSRPGCPVASPRPGGASAGSITLGCSMAEMTTCRGPARLAGLPPGDPEHGQVVGLGPAAGEDQPIGPWGRTDRRRGSRRSAPGLLPAPAGPSGRAGAGWPDWHDPAASSGHGLDHFRPGRRGRVVVQVDRAHGEG